MLLWWHIGKNNFFQTRLASIAIPILGLGLNIAPYNICIGFKSNAKSFAWGIRTRREIGSPEFWHFNLKFDELNITIRIWFFAPLICGRFEFIFTSYHTQVLTGGALWLSKNFELFFQPNLWDFGLEKKISFRIVKITNNFCIFINLPELLKNFFD